MAHYLEGKNTGAQLFRGKNTRAQLFSAKNSGAQLFSAKITGVHLLRTKKYLETAISSKKILVHSYLVPKHTGGVWRTAI